MGDGRNVVGEGGRRKSRSEVGRTEKDGTRESRQSWYEEGVWWVFKAHPALPLTSPRPGRWRLTVEGNKGTRPRGATCWMLLLGGSRDKDLSVAELRASPRRPKVLDEGRLRGPQARASRLFTPSRCLPRGDLPRHELNVGRTAPHPPDPDWCAIAQSTAHVIGRDAGFGDVVIWRMLSQRALLLAPIEPMWGFAVFFVVLC